MAHIIDYSQYVHRVETQSSTSGQNRSAEDDGGAKILLFTGIQVEYHSAARRAAVQGARFVSCTHGPTLHIGALH